MQKCLYIFILFTLYIPLTCMATPYEPIIAIENARTHCDKISNTFKSMKNTAQINTVITGVGTVAGVGATVVGIAKANIDKQADELISRVKQREETNGKFVMSAADKRTYTTQVLNLLPETTESNNKSKQQKLEQKSKNLGNWRTGLLAGNTATNIAGAIIAANNTTDDDLQTQLAKCKQSLSDLRDSKVQAHISNVDSHTIQKMENIISACSDYETLDITKIDNKAKGATISSGIGAGIGLAGTITSATANSESIRHDDSDSGMKKRKNLNTASNILAAGAGTASGVATVFNAQQSSTLKRAQNIATKCSEALNQ